MNALFISIPNEWERKRKIFYIYICILCFCSNLSISDDINFLGDRSENRCEKWHFWSEIESGFNEPRGKPALRIPRSTPIPRRTVVKTFHELEWCYLLYPRFGIYAGGKKRIEFLIHKSWQIEKVIGKISLSPDPHLCFLLSCFYKQTSAFMFIPPPLSAGDFSSILSGSVKCLPLLLDGHMQEKSSGIQGTSSDIRHNICRFLYLLLNIFFRDLRRPW